MADPNVIVASKAAAPTPDYRGVYFKTGSYNGKNSYKVEGAEQYLWWNNVDTWYISAVEGSGGAAFFTRVNASPVGAFTAGVGASGSIDTVDGGDVRLYLKEKDCKMVAIGTAGIPRTKQLTRRWDKLKDKLAQDAIDLLYDWTSAENFQELYYRDAPKAVGPRGDEVWPGRWRQVSVSRTADDPQGVTETLRLGFQSHSGSAGNPLDQDEARLGMGSGTPSTGDQQYRQDWRYTDPSDHEEILADLTAIASVSSPTVEGESVSGLFACAKIRSQPNEDGSILFSRLLTEMHTIDATGELDVLSPVITQEQELLNLFGFEPGDEEKLMYIYSNIDPASRVYCMETLTPTQITAIVGGTWQMYDRKFVVDKETNVATFAIVYMKETWDADYDDRNVIKGASLSGWMRNMVLQATGESQAQALLDFQLVVDEPAPAFDSGNQYTKGDTVTYTAKIYICLEPNTGAWDASDWVEAHYLLNGRNIQHAGKGQYIVTGDQISAYDGTAAADAIVTRAGDAFTETDRRVGVRVWFRRSYAAMTTITTPTTGEAWQDWTYDSDTYYSHNWSLEDHQNGTYTIRQFGWILTNDADDDGFLARIKPGITLSDQEMIVRSWPNLTLVARDLLIANGGKARSDYTIGSPIYGGNRTFTHADCFVEDRTEAGYTVRQVLVYLNDYADTAARNTAALIIRIKPSVTTHQQKMIIRVWPTVSEAEKDLLTASGGVARSAFTFESVAYSHADCFIDDRGRAGYTVRQILVELSAVTTDVGALVIRVRDQVGSSQALIQRVWPHRTLAAKNTLMTAVTGKARIDYTFEASLYTHVDAQVDDLGNGGYTVKQTLTFLGGGSWTNPASEWEVTPFEVIKTFTRSGDDLEKELTYDKYVAMRRSEEDAWEYITDTVGADKVAGSDHVVKKGRFQFLASVLVLTDVGDWT